MLWQGRPETLPAEAAQKCLRSEAEARLDMKVISLHYQSAQLWDRMKVMEKNVY